MYTNAFAYITSPTMPQASVASMMMSGDQATAGRMPVDIVPRPTADLDVQNNRQGSPNFSAPAEMDAPLSSAASSSLPPQNVNIARLPDIRISSFPSLFLAQLMGQGLDAEAEGIVVSYETMLQFSQVKYLPSNATRPALPSPMLDFYKNMNTEDMNTEELQAANTNPKTPVAANTNAASFSASTSQTEEAQPALAIIAKTAATPADSGASGFKPLPRKTLLRATGMEAYASVAFHNDQILESDEGKRLLA